MKTIIRSSILATIGVYSFELYTMQGMGINIASSCLTGGWMLLLATAITGGLSILFKQIFRKVDRVLR